MMAVISGDFPRGMPLGPPVDDLVEVSISDDYYTGPDFEHPPTQYGERAVVPRGQFDRWLAAYLAYGDAQEEMREVLEQARTARRAAQPATGVSRCYWVGQSRVHVKPGCACNDRRWTWTW